MHLKLMRIKMKLPPHQETSVLGSAPWGHTKPTLVCYISAR